MISVTLKYFGMVAEATQQQEEELVLDPTNQDLKTVVLTKYPNLENMTFHWAVNEELHSQLPQLHDRDIIALLPPFAGG